MKNKNIKEQATENMSGVEEAVEQQEEVLGLADAFAVEGLERDTLVREKKDHIYLLVSKLTESDDIPAEHKRHITDQAVEAAYASYLESERKKDIPTWQSFIVEVGQIDNEYARKLEEELAANDSLPKVKKHKKVGIIAAVLVIVALLSGGIAYAALNQGRPVEPEPTPTAPVVEEALDSNVFLTVDIGDAASEIELAANAKVEVLDKDATEENDPVIAETEVDVNKAVELGTLEEGEYILHVTQAPIHKDGSTYILPKEGSKFTVDGEGEDVKLTVELEPLAVEDMTKEQLEAIAAILEDAGHAQEATDMREKAQGAVSDPGSANNVAPGSSSPTTPGSTGNNTSGGGASNPGGSATPTQPTDPNAGKTWHEAETKQVWIVDRAAWTETVPVYGSVCNGCGAVLSDPVGHLKEAGRGSACQSYSTDVVIGNKTVDHPEQGHWETVIVRESGWY